MKRSQSNLIYFHVHPSSPLASSSAALATWTLAMAAPAAGRGGSVLEFAEGGG